MTPTFYALELYRALKKVNQALSIITNLSDTETDEIRGLNSLKDSLTKKIKLWIDIEQLESTDNNVLVLYAVQNEEGKYFRAKGYSASGSTWVDDINKAKIYPRSGGARGVITWFANNYPKYPTLKLLKLTVSNIEVMDETKRVEKAKEKKAKAEAAKAEREAKRKLADAERELERTKQRVNQLKQKN